MREETVNFQVAKLAKEKGFNWRNIEILEVKSKSAYLDNTTQSLLQRWLREVHNIRVLIDFETIDDSETAYTFKIVRDIPEGKDRKKDTWDFYETTYSFNQGGGWYKTYEEALEMGLQEALTLIK